MRRTSSAGSKTKPRCRGSSPRSANSGSSCPVFGDWKATAETLSGEAHLLRPNDDLISALDVELPVDVAQVGLQRVVRDEETRRDLVGRQAARQVAQDLHLPRAQPLHD